MVHRETSLSKGMGKLSLDSVPRFYWRPPAPALAKGEGVWWGLQERWEDIPQRGCVGGLPEGGGCLGRDLMGPARG